MAMINLSKLTLREALARTPAAFQRKPGATLVGLSFDGSRVELADNPAQQRLSDDPAASDGHALTRPLTADTELVGREIRNQLDAAGSASGGAQ